MLSLDFILDGSVLWFLFGVGALALWDYVKEHDDDDKMSH